MTPLIPVIQMNDVPMLVGVFAIKTIEDSTYVPKPIDQTAPKAKEGVAPATTQAVLPAPTDAVVPPVVCSTITFHDDKKLVVKGPMDMLHSMAAA